MLTVSLDKTNKWPVPPQDISTVPNAINALLPSSIESTTDKSFDTTNPTNTNNYNNNNNNDPSNNDKVDCLHQEQRVLPQVILLKQQWFSLSFPAITHNQTQVPRKTTPTRTQTKQSAYPPDDNGDDDDDDDDDDLYTLESFDYTTSIDGYVCDVGYYDNDDDDDDDGSYASSSSKEGYDYNTNVIIDMCSL